MKLMKRDPGKGYISDMLYVPKSLVNVQGVKKALEFELSERNDIRLLRLWEESEHHLVVPRSFWNPADFPTLQWIDARPRTYTRTGIVSKITLDLGRAPDGSLQPTGTRVQSNAIAALLKSTGGTLQLACGLGKSVVALELAARLQVPVVIAVDNTQLLAQWQNEVALHLDVPGGVGLIQGSTKDWKHGVVLATYHALANWAATMPEEVRRWFGLAIWDEGHHVNAPTFSKSAPLFYGYRLALTATPTRSDGSHVICQHHVGDIIFKEVRQKTPPRITFKWTGITLELDNPEVAKKVCDKNGEVHIAMLAGYLGTLRDRLNNHIIAETKAKVAAGHKVLVLSYSVDEVLNLMALWTSGDPNGDLYTDIPYPEPHEVGETAPPLDMKPSYAAKLQATVNKIWQNLRENPNLSNTQKAAFHARMDEFKYQLKQYDVFKKTERLYRQRQKAFLEDLLKKKSSAGLFTHAVKPAERMDMLKNRKVIFAIMKYGKEGLDDKDLSAIIVSEPMSDQNILQQVMGRPRGKTNAELVFFEDNIGPLMGQCQKLRGFLRSWDASEGGPFKFDQVGHPSIQRRDAWKTSQRLLRAPGS